MNLGDLSKISQNVLLVQFGSVVSREHVAIVEVIRYISAIRFRKIYALEGYSSVFSFLQKRYGYSGGGAYRRIQASKVMDLFPEVSQSLCDGKLNLMSLALIEPHLTKENGKELIQQIMGKKKEEVEYLISQLFGKIKKVQDKIRRLPVIPENTIEKSAPLHTTQKFVYSEESGKTSALDKPKKEAFNFHSENAKHKEEVRRVKVEFVCDEEVATMIERAKELMSHKYPEGKLEDLMREAFSLLLKKKNPIQKVDRENNTLSDKNKESGKHPLSLRSRATENRYIPTFVRNTVWKRDGGKCTHQGPGGRICEERSFLHVDHVKPWALGGETKIENLRLLCSVHNRLRAERTFQKTWG